MDCLDNKGPAARRGLMYFLKSVNFLNQELLLSVFKHFSLNIYYHNYATSNWSASSRIQSIQF